jgi:hypothetical protein
LELETVPTPHELDTDSSPKFPSVKLSLSNFILYVAISYSTLLKIKEAQNHCNFVLRTINNDDNDPPKRN